MECSDRSLSEWKEHLVPLSGATCFMCLLYRLWSIMMLLALALYTMAVSSNICRSAPAARLCHSLCTLCVACKRAMPSVARGVLVPSARLIRSTIRIIPGQHVRTLRACASRGVQQHMVKSPPHAPCCLVTMTEPCGPYADDSSIPIMRVFRWIRDSLPLCSL